MPWYRTQNTRFFCEYKYRIISDLFRGQRLKFCSQVTASNSRSKHRCPVCNYLYSNIRKCDNNLYTVVPTYPLIQYPRIAAARKRNLKIKEINVLISFKTPAKRERAVTWLNPTAQTRPIPDSFSFVPTPTLPRRTCLRSATSVLAVRICCCEIAVFVFRKPFFIN
jgi:hypothetical protein